MPHTPGPWFIAPADIVPGIRGLGIFGHRGTLGVPVAEVFNVFGDVMKADARPIAAAPLLLEALQAVEWVTDYATHGLYCPWCKGYYPDHAPDCARQAALAYATGAACANTARTD